MRLNPVDKHWWNKVLCLYFTLLYLAYADGHWKYESEHEWHHTFPGCGGNSQSPIALHEESSEIVNSIDFIKLLDFDEPTTASICNNGHAVDMNFEYDESRQPRITVLENGRNSIFTFRGLHFHWPSEHTFDETRYELEAHMLHKNPENGKMLVFGYAFEICETSNPGIDVIAPVLQWLQKVNESVQLYNFPLSSVMPQEMDVNGYFKYNGSLTTPPCTEDVIWLMRKEPLCLQSWQMQNFRLVQNDDGEPMTRNARPLQETNGRTVQFLDTRCCVRI